VSKKVRKEDALDYHSQGRPGKIEVIATKPTATASDLSLAYTPGVAEPCLEIARDPDLSYKYTARGNLVAVISNGTAVLGLGDIGPWAGKPVMEGKGVLFKKFADIDVFDLNVDAKRSTASAASCVARAHLRRHQPRRHQGPRVLHHRGAPQERDVDTRLPR
jgi:malic enzyme